MVRKFEILNYYSIHGFGMNSSSNIFTSCFKKPSRLDIVVVKTTKYNEGEKIISRIVGVPGDTLVIKNGVLFVNGKDVDKLLGIIATDTINSDPLVIDKGKAFLMGDNRKKSYDSRHYGQIDLEEIIATKL
jgi:signal peptidase I